MRSFRNWQDGRLSHARQMMWIVSWFISVLIFPLPAVAQGFTGFTSVSPPFTGATDFITDFPYCFEPNSGKWAGPIGLLFDGTHFFATDFCNATIYRFTAAGGSATNPDALLNNGLTDGLALVNGVYYGTSNIVASPDFPGWPGIGVYTFDPNTLAVNLTPVALFPNFVLDIAPYPLNPDFLAVSGFGGLYTLQVSTSTLTQISPYGEDGIAYTQDGSRFYEAFGQHVYGFDLTQSGTPVVLDVDLSIDTPPDTPDGMAVAQSYAMAGGINVSNNVFVNTWNGHLLRIDTNDGNAVSTVASGGSRGDFVTVGSDGCLYATQSDRIEKMSPCFFAPFVVGNNTLSGSDVSVVLGSGTVTFGTVTAPGSTSVTPLDPAAVGPLPPPPGSLVPGTYLDVATSATYSGPVTVCFDYIPPGIASLFHLNNATGNWVDVTTSNTPQLPPPNDTEGNVCGQVSSLSPFLVAHSVENEVKGLFAAGEIKNQGLENALLSYLAAAASARAKDKCRTAGNILHEFIDLVKAQSGKGIVKSAAANLIKDAQYLISHCSGA